MIRARSVRRVCAVDTGRPQSLLPLVDPEGRPRQAEERKGHSPGGVPSASSKAKSIRRPKAPVQRRLGSLTKALWPSSSPGATTR